MVIGISFPRYSSRTVKAMKFAYDRGATVIALTDILAARHRPGMPPMTLIAMSDMVSLVDSLVAPLSVVNALIVACSYRKEEAISKHLRQSGARSGTSMGSMKRWTTLAAYDVIVIGGGAAGMFSAATAAFAGVQGIAAGEERIALAGSCPSPARDAVMSPIDCRPGRMY